MWQARVRGSSLAWTAVFLSVVIFPLLLLIADGARLLYVHGRLAAAADAACEDYSWSLADRIQWQYRQDDRYAVNDYLAARAIGTFFHVLSEQQTSVRYTPSFIVHPDLEAGRVECLAWARMPLLMLAGQEVTIRTTADSKIRFAR